MDIRNEIKEVIREVIDNSFLEPGDSFVIGCSTSEIMDKKIGSCPSKDLGEEIFDIASGILSKRDIYLAAQSCEHLNRALVVEKDYAKANNLTIVNAVPHKDAGGSFATAAYQGMENPVLVENIKAKAGIDIGDTLIGMHLDAVAVPLRLKHKSIGKAHLTAAIVRPKLIGGARAQYK